MERNNQHDIQGMKNSRFSPEERAIMSQDNEQYRAAAKESRYEASLKRNSRAVKKASAGKNISNPSDKARKTAKVNSGDKQSASRNERVKSSSENRKKHKKLQNNLIIIMLLVVAVALLGAFASFAMKVNAIEVTGSERYSDKSVLTAAGIDTGDSMLLINLRAMEHKIESKLPYIEDAVITRVWPDKVSIALTDAQPTLAVDSGTGYILMNNSCKVLDDDAVVINESALIKGISIVNAVPGEIAQFADDISTEDFVKLCNAFAEYGIEDISEYDLTSVSNISVIIGHRIEVQLGTLAGAADKLAFCKAVVEETIASDSKHPMVIDITADGKAYARRKDDNNVSFNDDVTEEATVQNEEASAVG